MDHWVLAFFNQFAQRWQVLDQFIAMLCANELLKFGLGVVVLWSLWFTAESQDGGSRTRKTLLATVIAAVGTLFLTRGLASALPFRPRPMHDPALDFVLPYGMKLATLDGWSSFPSDHAALAFGLATGLFFISRPLGLAAGLYALLVISLPRVYAGLHYPSDILGGALLGILCVALANLAWVRERVTSPLLAWMERQPLSFYGVFFFLTLQIATMFNSSRALPELLSNLH